MTGFVDNVAYKPKSGRHSAPSFHLLRHLWLWVDSALWLDTYVHVASVSMVISIQCGHMLRSLCTWSQSFKCCPLSSLAVMGEPDIFEKHQVLNKNATLTYTTKANSLPRFLCDYLTNCEGFTKAVSQIVLSLCESLTRPCSPIIGPPGTGKTILLSELLSLFLNMYNKKLWKTNRVPWFLITAWTNAAVGVLDDSAWKSKCFSDASTVYLCSKKKKAH